MNITEVGTYTVGNPWKNWVFVKLFTDETMIGQAQSPINTPINAHIHATVRRWLGTL